MAYPLADHRPKHPPFTAPTLYYTALLGQRAFESRVFGNTGAAYTSLPCLDVCRNRGVEQSPLAVVNEYASRMMQQVGGAGMP